MELYVSLFCTKFLHTVIVALVSKENIVNSV